MSSQLRQIESIREFMGHYGKSEPEVLYLVSGELLNEVREEFDKGRQARQLLQMVVEFGSDSS